MLMLIIFCGFFIYIDATFYKVCQNNKFKIECKPGTSIRIHCSYYCSEDSRNCCKPDSSYQVVSQICNYEQSCEFPLDENMFARSCPKGPKCLHVDYLCRTDYTNKTRNCGLNEERVNCKSACPQICDKDNPVCTKNCAGVGCQCKKGYFRDRNRGICMLKKYCPLKEENYEVFSLCRADVQRTCPIFVKPAPNATSTTTECTTINETICQPGYICKFPRIRDPLSRKCVFYKNCPKF